MAGLRALDGHSFSYHNVVADPSLNLTNTPLLACPNNCQGSQWSRRLLGSRDLPQKPVFVLGPDNQAFQLVGGSCGYFEFQDWQCRECLAECYVCTFHWARSDFESGFCSAPNPQAEFFHSKPGPQETPDHIQAPLTDDDGPWSSLARFGNDESPHIIGEQQSKHFPPQSPQQVTSQRPPTTAGDSSPVQPDQGSDWQVVDRQNYKRRSRSSKAAQSQSDHAVYNQPASTLHPSTPDVLQNNMFNVLSTSRIPGSIPMPGSAHAMSSRSSSASNIGGKRFENDPYKGWHYNLFRLQGNKACSHCRHRKIQCQLGHLARKDLARITRDFWDKCPDKARMLAELKQKGSPYTIPPFSV